MTEPGRFRDRRERKYGYDFVDEVLVVCPHCDGCAVVAPCPERSSVRRRLRCAACGYAKDKTVNSVVVGGPVDPWFRRPVWLRATCRGHVLWAYNGRHLDLLKSYVAARLRERGRMEPGAPQSLVERLPTWLKTAKNRDEILRTIRRLRCAIPSSPPPPT
ncbi:hypothetical protein BLA60_39295 [Actinophytocola xinjiangensis]|uniref:Uncharacterized protein n=1 Tax=Actinophytocola xinjiangensis TaxID=485602 RepID=A0A7Z1AV13_9PSEU|nr:hypothetical protein BLA60_39295 [Actinophytocola xinjiangensis]